MGRKTKKEKRELYLFGYPIKGYIPILYFFSVIAAVNVVLESLDKDNFWVMLSIFYLGCSFAYYFYFNEKDKEEHKSEIAELNKKISHLEYLRESDKQTIKLLTKELEKVEDKSLL